MDSLLKKRSSSTSCLPSLVGNSDDMKTEHISKYEGITLTVSNLHADVTLDLLKQEFSRFGKIVNAKIAKDYPDSFMNTGYVSYYSPAEAHRAVEGLNGSTILNCTVYVGLPKPRQRKRSKTYYRVIPHQQSFDLSHRTRSDSNSTPPMLSTSWEMSSLHRRKTSGESLIDFKKSVLSRRISSNT